jgi:predicted Kef-type K+ transport protein
MPLGALALVVIVIIFGKATILAAVVRAFGYWNIVPLAVGLTLFRSASLVSSSRASVDRAVRSRTTSTRSR